MRVPFFPSAHEKLGFVVGSLYLGLCRVLKIDDRKHGSQNKNDLGKVTSRVVRIHRAVGSGCPFSRRKTRELEGALPVKFKKRWELAAGVWTSSGVFCGLVDDAEVYVALLMCSGSYLGMSLLFGLGLFGRLFLPKE